MERNWRTPSFLTHLEETGFTVLTNTNKATGKVHKIGKRSFLLLPRKEQIDVLNYASSHSSSVDGIIFYQKPDMFVIPIEDIKSSMMKKFETLTDFVNSYKNNVSLLSES